MLGPFASSGLTSTPFRPAPRPRRVEPVAAMIVTTTNTIEGHRITAYHGIITGEAILGADLFKDIFAGIRNIVGGRAGAYEKELRRARETALTELEQLAREIGADAVIGVDLDYEVIGTGSSMLMVSASGTAVKLG